MEDTERGRYVTALISDWICNDGDHIKPARSALRLRGVDRLREYLISTIRLSQAHSAPWHVKQELAANDYDRVDWQSVSDDLRKDVA